jgi:hypothetical protein
MVWGELAMCLDCAVPQRAYPEQHLGGSGLRGSKAVTVSIVVSHPRIARIICGKQIDVNRYK